VTVSAPTTVVPPDLRTQLAASQRTSTSRKLLGLGALIVVAGIALVLGLALGARDIDPLTVIATLLGHGDPSSYEALVILTERLPRTVLGLIVGACLGASGVVMQALTRNPLADPGVLGVELGAAFAVLIGILFFGVRGASSYFWWALLGAAVTAAAVLAIARLASTVTSATVSLVIAGAAMSAMLGSLITLLIVRDTAVYAHYNYWSVGQLNGRGGVLDEIWPFALAGLLLVLPLGRTLNALSLGDDVAAVGPVAFVGLIGALTARLLVGGDHRWLIPYGALCGAVLLLVADVACRLVPGSGELQVAIATAVIGAPVFIALARGRKVVPA
jgi:iron complex transport system permease protein